MSKFIEKLSENFREEFKAFLPEGYTVTRASLQAVLGAAFSRVMASAITMRRAFWE